MRLTKQTGHAIRILIDCANCPDQLLKVADISDRLGVTKQNVFKIVHILSHAGFVAAARGPNGGVRLTKPAKSIKVGDVVRAIEETRFRVEGGGAKGASRVAPINAMLDDALNAFITVLDQHTLAELADTRKLADFAGETQQRGSSGGRTAAAQKAPATRGSRRS